MLEPDLDQVSSLLSPASFPIQVEKARHIFQTLRISYMYLASFCVRPWAETKSWHFGLPTKKPGLERGNS